MSHVHFYRVTRSSAGGGEQSRVISLNQAREEFGDLAAQALHSPTLRRLQIVTDTDDLTIEFDHEMQDGQGRSRRPVADPLRELEGDEDI
jgi:hypothetical protein